MSPCGDCRFATWFLEPGQEELDRGECQPIPHLPPAEIGFDDPSCALFGGRYGEEPRTMKPDEEAEADTMAEEPEEKWAAAGMAAKAQRRQL